MPHPATNLQILEASCPGTPLQRQATTPVLPATNPSVGACLVRAPRFVAKLAGSGGLSKYISQAARSTELLSVTTTQERVSALGRSSTTATVTPSNYSRNNTTSPPICNLETSLSALELAGPRIEDLTTSISSQPRHHFIHTDLSDCNTSPLPVHSSIREATNLSTSCDTHNLGTARSASVQLDFYVQNDQNDDAVYVDAEEVEDEDDDDFFISNPSDIDTLSLASARTTGGLFPALFQNGQRQASTSVGLSSPSLFRRPAAATGATCSNSSTSSFASLL
ncbi:unnamed protein product, partial [Protopolystoma xenopodis]